MPNLNGHAESIKNSQFKAAWQSGPTRTIRVPIVLADITLEYARQLDQGIEPRDTSAKAGIDIGTFATEPRDTGTKTDIDAASFTCELRDTAIKVDSPANSSVEPILDEPRDTAKLRAKLEDARAEYNALLESSTHITNKLREEVAKLRSQVATERADREEIEMQLADLKQNSAPASDLFDKVSKLVSLFKTLLPEKAKLPKGTTSKIEGILRDD